MSEQNVEAFRRAVEAYNARDVEVFLETFDQGAEWHALTQAMFGGETTVYRGHEGVRQFMREVDEAFVDVQIEQLEIRDLGERIIASARLTARGRASGAVTQSPISWVVDFRDGRVARMRDYLDLKDALGAAGLSDQ
jgi:ketosteroid isomerase-like protein